MLAIFLKALGLAFVIEGLMPFISPSYWRRCLHMLDAMSNDKIRLFGLFLLLIGTGIVVVVHYSL